MKQLANGNVEVTFKGRAVEVSPEEYHVLYLRGHLLLVYKNADIVSEERGFVSVLPKKGGDAVINS